MHKQDRFGGSGGHGRRFTEAELVEKFDNPLRGYDKKERRNTRHAGVLTMALSPASYAIERNRFGAAASGVTAGVGGAMYLSNKERKAKAKKAASEGVDKALPNGLRRAVGLPTIAKVPKKDPVKLPPLDWDGPKARPARKVGPYEHVSPYDRPRDAAARANAARRPAASAGPSRSDLRAQDKIAWHNSNLDREPRGIYKADVAKAARYYDPEHRRQRRLGLYEAGALGGGLAAGGVGGVSTYQDSKKLRATVLNPNARDKTKRVALGSTKAGKGALKLTKLNAALLAGGAAGVGGAALIREKAEGRKLGDLALMPVSEKPRKPMNPVPIYERQGGLFDMPSAPKPPSLPKPPKPMSLGVKAGIAGGVAAAAGGTGLYLHNRNQKKGTAVTAAKNLINPFEEVVVFGKAYPVVEPVPRSTTIRALVPTGSHVGHGNALKHVRNSKGGGGRATRLERYTGGHANQRVGPFGKGLNFGDVGRAGKKLIGRGKKPAAVRKPSGPQPPDYDFGPGAGPAPDLWTEPVKKPKPIPKSTSYRDDPQYRQVMQNAGDRERAAAKNKRIPGQYRGYSNPPTHRQW